MSKTILIVVPHFVAAYSLRKELIVELVKQGWHVAVVLPWDGSSHLLEEIGCREIHVPIDRRGMNPIRDALLFLRYLKILRQVRPDAVLTYTAKPNIYAGLATRLLRIDTWPNITGTGSTFLQEGFKARLIRTLYRPALKRARAVFFQNDADLRYFQEHKLFRGRVVRVPGSGVNLHKYGYSKPSQQREVNFVFVGRILALKGIESYLRCAEVVRATTSPARFHVVGEPDEQHWVGVLADLESRGVVNVHGFKSDVAAIMRQSDCIVLPSLGGEGVPNVVLEASATGRPCIGSDIPGTRDAIVHGVTGLTFPPGDVDALVDAVQTITQLTPEERTAMGARARRWVEQNFDRRIVVERYLDELDGREAGNDGSIP